MKFIRDYSVHIFLYGFFVLYAIFFNNQIFIILGIVILFAYSVIYISDIKEKHKNQTKKLVSRLRYQIDESNKEKQDQYMQFISLSKTLGSGVLVIDMEGTIVFANKDVGEFFHKDFNELNYNNVSITPLYKFINSAYITETKRREQIAYNNKTYDLSSRPIIEGGLFKGCLIVIHDITVIKNAENMQKRFTADVSHELRTPLASIKGLSEILARDTDISEDDRDEFVHLINKESTRMETILSDLLVISKLDRLDYELKIEEVNISELIQSSANLLKRSADSKGLTIHCETDDAILKLDSEKFERAILNLIKNALNYTDHGAININGKLYEDRYEIIVSDTGIGIEENELNKIFKRFYRVDKTRSRDTGGSGLGLSIVKNVVMKHGGAIDVVSKLKEGTTFTIQLPIK